MRKHPDTSDPSWSLIKQLALDNVYIYLFIRRFVERIKNIYIFILQCKTIRARGDMLILTCSFHGSIKFFVKGKNKLKKTYHNVVGREYGLSTSVFGKGAATLSLEEWVRSGSNIDVFLLGSTVNFTEILERSCISAR